MLLRFGIDDVSKKVPKGQKGFKSMPVNHSQEKVDASAGVGFPMLIGAGENGQKTVVRSDMNRIIKLGSRLLIGYPFGNLFGCHALHGLRIIAVIVLGRLLGRSGLFFILCKNFPSMRFAEKVERP